MQNFQDTFETRKQSLISDISIFMSVRIYVSTFPGILKGFWADLSLIVLLKFVFVCSLFNKLHLKS